MGRVLTRGGGTDVETCDFFYLGRGAAGGGGRFGTLTGWGWMDHAHAHARAAWNLAFWWRNLLLPLRHSSSRAGGVAVFILLLLA